MEGVPDKAATLSLSKSFNECIQLFLNFRLALSNEDCRVVRLGQVDLTEVSDQYGRAKIWGDQMRTDLPERARGSLDDTLRHDDDLKGLVKNIFLRLGGLLRQGKSTSIAERKYDPVLGSDRDSISSVSADDSDSDSDSDSDDNDDDKPQSKRMPKIRLLVQQITDQIRSLYDLSSLLRRPRIADKYIRSVNSKSHSHRTASDQPATLPFMVCFSKLDESHIIEKVLQWRGLTKSGQNFSCEDEAPAQERHGLATGDIGDIMWYCQRLARANTRRREQLQHWADHPYISTHDKLTLDRPLPVLVKPTVKASEIKEESASQVSTLKPASFKFSPASPESIMSKQSFSTAAVSDVHDTKTNARPQTVYAATNVGQCRSNAVPDPPKMQDGRTTFLCPYCGTNLDSSEMQNRQSWKRHVFRDLRPYICTFEHCQNPDKLYVSRHEWIYHELQIHRRKYVCKDCPKTYSSRTEMSAHVQGHYGESISPAQLGVILDLCDQQDDSMNGEKNKCLVCEEELSFLALQGHLATHMEDMALFVLPNIQEGQDMGGTNDSVRAEKLQSKGEFGDSKSQTSSLGFSAAGDHGQAPVDFSKLLTSEEAGYSSKFTHWKVTDNSEVASLKALVQQLEDQKEKVRHAAVKALGSHPDLPDEIIEAMGARLECRDGNGRTVLSWAAETSHAATFRRLIMKGVDVESRDGLGRTTLHYAVMNGNEAIIRMLLDSGANPRTKDKYGGSPLHWAVWDDKKTIIRILFAVGADVNCRDEDRQSPLHYAAESGSEAAVGMLLEKGADFGSRDMNGQSPLHCAAMNGNEAVVRMLLEVGADVDCRTEDGQSPLHYAAESGSEAAVRMLLKKGAEGQMKDKEGNTPLSLATKSGHQSIIQLLQQDTDYPASNQLLIPRHSTPPTVRDVTAAISLTEIDLKSLPPLYKKVRKGWHAVFNPQLQRDLDVDLVHVFKHFTTISSVTFSHDGMYIATGSYRTARIFDIQTGEQVCVLDHSASHANQSIYISSVSFSPDGHCLATGAENMVYLWDIKSGTILAQLEGHKNEVNSIEFSSDGRSIVSGAVDKTVRLWDVDTRANARILSAEASILSVTFSPDLQLIASGSADRSIRVWEASTGILRACLDGPEGHSDAVYSVAFSPDGETLASTSIDKTVKVWHLGMRAKPQSPWEVKCIKTLQGHSHFVYSVTFTPDGNGLLSGSADTSLHFSDPKTGVAQFMLVGHGHTVNSVAVSPRGGIFATSSIDGEARVWSYGPYQAERA